MDRLDQVVTATAVEHGFSGVVRVDTPDATHEWAFGSADRRNGLANTTETRFAIASGAKGFTALTVMALELGLDAERSGEELEPGALPGNAGTAGDSADESSSAPSQGPGASE